MQSISRLLIANRGEIALRIIRACKELGIVSVLATSESDRESLPAKEADDTVCIGPSRSGESYLNTDAVLCAAVGKRAEALHPGYGFLAERAELSERCKEAGIIFVGPSPGNIASMGDKLAARKIAEKSGVRIIPGSESIRDFAEAISVAEEIGFPVLLKAAAGGGGKGIRTAGCLEELRTAFESAAGEAHESFGDGTLYIERHIANARHIEVQIVADSFGNIVHLGERDCSLQRRYQKMIEEAPAPQLTRTLREDICDAALAIAKSISYRNAGTIEFILDQDTEEFYFLEMNTRIQVEHPVTEMITGIDLVKEQISIADGQPLSIAQEDVSWSGHAIECRINAESVYLDFTPCPGLLTHWEAPVGADVRVDSHCYSGYFVPPFYDSLLAKVIVRGNTRVEAIDMMKSALDRFVIGGVDSTIPFLRSVMTDTEFRVGGNNTKWLEEKLAGA